MGRKQNHAIATRAQLYKFRNIGTKIIRKPCLGQNKDVASEW